MKEKKGRNHEKEGRRKEMRREEKGLGMFLSYSS